MSEFPTQLDPLQKAQITEAVLPPGSDVADVEDAGFQITDEAVILFVTFLDGEEKSIQVTREELSRILYPSIKISC